MKNISKTIKTAAPVVAGLLAFTAMAHADVMIEVPLHHVIAGLLARVVGVVVFFFSLLGLLGSKGRVFGAAVVGAFLSAALFVAPDVAPGLIYGFSAAVAEMLPW